jgi:serine protease Do
MTFADQRLSTSARWCLLAFLGVWGRSAFAQPPTPPEPAPPAPISASAQRVYEDARAQLLQVRTLLKGQDTQASVGSGFLVSDQGHIITNYHVVSQAALQPERYRLVYGTADRTHGQLQLLAFDAIHDLALVKTASPAAVASRRPLRFRPRAVPMSQGERIYSLGNPLDVGFAVIEGTYNGLVDRSFYPTIFFAGSLNPGVSGGPTLDQQGLVMGINVAARRDGEQVSFLVPAPFAEDLLERGRTATPLVAPAYPELTRQLTTHQATLAERFLAQRWRTAGHPHYVIPLPQEDFMRCWGRSTAADAKGLEYEQSNCEMDSRVFVTGRLTTGSVSVRHEAYDGHKLGILRFSDRYSDSFKNETFGRGGKDRTAPQCHERYIDRGGLPLRAVLCMSAYRKLTGLYDVSVLVATVDASRTGVQGRFDARGVSFDNALKLSAYYLEGLGWTRAGMTGRR